MIVQKVGVNSSVSCNFGAGYQTQTPQTLPAQTPVQPKKDRSKVIAWTTAGLAVAGLAGVLIYNARKGKTPASSDPMIGVGTFVRKFLDENIFAKGANDAKNGVEGITFKVSSDGNDLQLYDVIENFKCHLVKKVPEGRTDVPNLEFDSPALRLKVFNKDTDSAKIDFALGQFEEFKLSMDVDSWRGKVKGCSATYGKENYTFTTEQCQDMLEKLDMKKLVSDKEYRVNYIDSLLISVGDVVHKTKIERIAQKSGKTFDEVEQIRKSTEFMRVIRVRAELADFQEHVGFLGTPRESEILKGFYGKDNFDVLDDFVCGKQKFEVMDDFVETDVRFPQDKICFDVKLPREDGAGELEHFRFSQDREYILYEKFNPENPSDIFRTKLYYPKNVEDNASIIDLTSRDASLYMEATLGGRNYVEVTNLENPDAPLKFYFNTNRAWNEDIEYGEELQPHMAYIEKLATILSDGEVNESFLHDFAVRGREVLEGLMK